MWLWKESINIDGHRFHQYQQNWTEPAEHKMSITYDLELQVQTCDRHSNVSGLNQLMGSQSFRLECLYLDTELIFFLLPVVDWFCLFI